MSKVAVRAPAPVAVIVEDDATDIEPTVGAFMELNGDAYADGLPVAWAYARALLAFRTEGDTDGARELREKAKKVNTFVPAYLTGRKRLPADLPDRIGFGDESEAMAYAEEQMAAWRKTPNAIAWLDALIRGTTHRRIGKYES